MNCVVCGSPLLFDRVVFRCSCGAFVHSHCWDKHVLQTHKPTFEIGNIDLNSEFKPIESEVAEETQDEQVATVVAEEEIQDKQVAMVTTEEEIQEV